MSDPGPSDAIRYHRQNVEDARSHQKTERARQQKVMDDTDFYLGRKKHVAPDGVTRVRIWPPPQAKRKKR